MAPTRLKETREGGGGYTDWKSTKVKVEVVEMAMKEKKERNDNIRQASLVPTKQQCCEAE